VIIVVISRFLHISKDHTSTLIMYEYIILYKHQVQDHVLILSISLTVWKKDWWKCSTKTKSFRRRIL